MAREYVSKDNKELFEEMVQDWIYDAETNPEYEDLEYDDERICIFSLDKCVNA